MKFVVGDIHGEISKLKSLIIELAKFNIDELIFIGDYIDKGENSKKTLEYLIDLSSKYKCTYLIGNHEFYWLKFLKENDKYSLEKLKKYGGITTVIDLGLKDFNKEQLNNSLYLKYKFFFDNLKPYYENDKYFIIHSGIPSNQYNSFIDINSIENYLIQRYDFIVKQELYHNKKIIFGHTGFVYPYYDGYKIGVDTSAVYGYNLTAFSITDNFFINNLGEKVELYELDLTKLPIIPRNLPKRCK